MRRFLVKKKTGPGVDMFPFLGIIVCVIGVVIFLISGLVAVDGLAITQGPGVEELDRLIVLADKMLPSADRIAEITAEIKAIQERVEQQDALRKRIETAQNETEGAKKELASPELQERLRLQEQIGRMRGELDQAQKELAKMPIEIEKAKKDVSDSEGSVTLPPLMGAGGRVMPVWIECHTAGLTIYRARKGGELSRVDIPLGDIADSDEFSQLIDEAARSRSQGGKTVINLLVRTNGVKAYDNASSLVIKKEAPFSAIPVVRSGKIRFREQSSARQGR